MSGEQAERLINYMEQMLDTVSMQSEDFAGVIASNAAIVLSLFAVCGCLIGFFAGVELLKIWNS